MNRKALIAFLVLIVGAGTAFAQARPLKIGVFDADRVMNETEEGKRVQVKLTAFRDKKADKRPWIGVYGGALHNDRFPAKGVEDWSYASAV